ncbi:hypothetical protein, partial [Bifidobacterium longum]|uniref:hypothetical protein n=1 Tax=Bifidobacterium longum TaxID=216816 RepID=UPI001A955F4F
KPQVLQPPLESAVACVGEVMGVRSTVHFHEVLLNSRQVIGSRLQKLNNLWANQPFRSSPWGWCMYCSTQAMLVFGEIKSLNYH